MNEVDEMAILPGRSSSNLRMVALGSDKDEQRDVMRMFCSKRCQKHDACIHGRVWCMDVAPN
jgi:hypothetical protein